MSEHARTAILFPAVQYKRPLHIHQWAIRKEQQLFTSLLDAPVLDASTCAADLTTSAGDARVSHSVDDGNNRIKIDSSGQYARQWCPADGTLPHGALLPLEPLLCTDTRTAPHPVGIDVHTLNLPVLWATAKMERALLLCTAVLSAFPVLDVPTAVQVCVCNAASVVVVDEFDGGVGTLMIPLCDRLVK